MIVVLYVSDSSCTVTVPSRVLSCSTRHSKCLLHIFSTCEYSGHAEALQRADVWASDQRDTNQKGPLPFSERLTLYALNFNVQLVSLSRSTPNHPSPSRCHAVFGPVPTTG